MSGIYIHIPFCKKACHYCNFHFSTNLTQKDRMVDAICKDIILNCDYLKDKSVGSIYFGGGTPSILSEQNISDLLNIIYKYFAPTNDAEITFECNPDDIDSNYLRVLKQTGINRLSIGIQSFFDEDLNYMNRVHRGKEAKRSIEMAQDFGFYNLSTDLIYGSSTTSSAMWAENIDILLKYKVPHISAYCLTIEEKTVFGNWVKEKKMKNVDDAKAIQQYSYLIDTLAKNDFLHYEISNFGKSNAIAVHNTNYWKGVHYLGVGPSAHSFNGNGRRWNIANNSLFMTNVERNQNVFEEEILTLDERFNEYIMTGLRTMWGIDLETAIVIFGHKYGEHLINNLNDSWFDGLVQRSSSCITLTNLGKFQADGIASRLFI